MIVRCYISEGKITTYLIHPCRDLETEGTDAANEKVRLVSKKEVVVRRHIRWYAGSNQVKREHEVIPRPFARLERTAQGVTD